MKKTTISIQECLYCLMAMLMLVGATIFPNFATDTYATFAHPADAAVDMLTRNGRPVTGLIYKIAVMFNITGVASIWVYTILGFVCLYLAIVLYQESIRKYIKNDLIRCLVSVLAICNIYIVEFLMFLEKVAFLLAILCCVIAYRGVKKVIEGESINKIIDFVGAMVALIIAACTYQPVLSLFVVLLLPIILRKQYVWKDKFKWLFVSVVMYGGAGFFDLLILKLCGSARVGNKSSILEKLSTFLSLPLNSITSFGIVPKGFWILTVAVIMLAVLILAKKSEKLNVLLHMFLVASGIEVCALSTIILGVGWFSPRVIYVFASLPMIVVVFAFVNEVFADKKDYDYSVMNKLLIGIVALNLVVSSIGLNHIYKDKYITNSLDEYRCYMIGYAIQKYEESTGITVNKIVFYEDQHLDEYEALLSSDSQFRMSSFNPSWSEIRAIEYYLGRTFERGGADETIRNEFSKKDWTVYSEEQLKFKGDTLHICKY